MVAAIPAKSPSARNPHQANILFLPASPGRLVLPEAMLLLTARSVGRSSHGRPRYAANRLTAAPQVSEGVVLPMSLSDSHTDSPV